MHDEKHPKLVGFGSLWNVQYMDGANKTGLHGFFNAKCGHTFRVFVALGCQYILLRVTVLQIMIW